MTLYETIYARRSVRRYDKTPLTEAELSRINAYLLGVTQLPGQSARFEIVDGGKLKGGLAPYAILAFADDGDGDGAMINIGYVLQEVDLFLQSEGFGSVWCGMASPKEHQPGYRILLGFGPSSAPLRGGEADFKRKKLSDVSNEDNATARAVRLAPSAVNFQPWKMEFADGLITIHSNVRGVGKILPGRFYLYDLGIALKHAQTALTHQGRKIEDIKLDGGGKDSFAQIRYS